MVREFYFRPEKKLQSTCFFAYFATNIKIKLYQKNQLLELADQMNLSVVMDLCTRTLRISRWQIRQNQDCLTPRFMLSLCFDLVVLVILIQPRQQQ